MNRLLLQEMNRTVYCLRLKLLFLWLCMFVTTRPTTFHKRPTRINSARILPTAIPCKFLPVFFFHGVLFRRFRDQYESSTSFLNNFLSMTYHLYPCKFVLSSQRLQYSKWTAGPFSSVTFRYILIILCSLLAGIMVMKCVM